MIGQFRIEFYFNMNNIAPNYPDDRDEMVDCLAFRHFYFFDFRSHITKVYCTFSPGVTHFNTTNVNRNRMLQFLVG